MDALRGTYIWLHRKNIEMQQREQAAWNAFGRQVDVPGLALDAHDLAELDDGMNRIANAKDRLRVLIQELGGEPFPERVKPQKEAHPRRAPEGGMRRTPRGTKRSRSSSSRSWP